MSAAASPLLQTDHLSLQLGARQVLRELDFVLAPGDRCVLLGPNGAGKSSLLRALSGEWKQHRLPIQLAGEPLHQWTERALAQRRAYLPQHQNPAVAFTVAETLGLGRWATGDTRPEQPAVRQALAAFCLEDYAQRPLHKLSGGERQRVHLARTWAQLWGPPSPPRIWLLDEPAAHLDPAVQQHLLGLLRNWCAQGHAALLVLHDLSLAANWANRIYLLNHGRLVAAGPPQTVLTEPNLYRTYNHPHRVLQLPDTGEWVFLPQQQPVPSGEPQAD